VAARPGLRSSLIDLKVCQVSAARDRGQIIPLRLQPPPALGRGIRTGRVSAGVVCVAPAARGAFGIRDEIPDEFRHFPVSEQ
jgi:hypothetical protein